MIWIILLSPLILVAALCICALLTAPYDYEERHVGDELNIEITEDDLINQNVPIL